MITQVITNDDDNGVLDLSVRKRLPLLLSPPSSTASSSSSTSSSMISPKFTLPIGKRMLDLPPTNSSILTPKVQSAASKRPLRFQCKHCDYKAPSTSLMQNHIYRHTDLTPYACAYCGHKSTTKSTIMVHIELCHPNMEVKILENRVREQDFYRDLNSTEISTLSNTIQEPQTKKPRRSIQYDKEIKPINGVAVPFNTMMNDGNDLSPIASDEICDIDNCESMLLPIADILDDGNEQGTELNNQIEISPSLKLKCSSSLIPLADLYPSADTKGSDSEDDGEYLLVYNRPKQYYGSLYEPEKQYACRLCSYTTNHRPSMEDHVFVHTNERPYKCGYCGEEIHTRYAATYHIKYKHTGMPRNFIQNKADITQYYVNRAKKEEEKNQFKVVDTRRVKVPVRNNNKSDDKQQNKHDNSIEHSIQHETSSCSSPPISTTSTQSLTSPSNNSQTVPTPDYRFLLAWSYYLATQAATMSPALQQQGQSPFSLPTDPETAAKFLQTMQAMMNPLATLQTLNNRNNEQSDVESKKTFPATREKANKS
ncbi:hypothetical protein I4U23_000965 [Adineta vaga]|nr:hypothetical protein I4U23_000965 [Adineta vaga]